MERPKYLDGETMFKYLFALPFCVGKKVLDIGCGFGFGSAILASNQALTVLGIDYDKAAITKARSQNKQLNLSFKHLPAQSLASLDAVFDIIIAFEVLEHLSLADSISVIKLISQHLTPGGIFIMSTPNKKISSPNQNKPLNPYHLNEFEAEHLKKIFKNTAFTSSTVFGLTPQSIELQQFREEQSRSLFWKIIAVLCQHKSFLGLISLIPQRVKNKVTQKPSSISSLSYQDYQISTGNLNKAHILMAICIK